MPKMSLTVYKVNSKVCRSMQQFAHQSIQLPIANRAFPRWVRRFTIAAVVATSINSISSGTSPLRAIANQPALSEPFLIADSYCEGRVRDGLISGRAVCTFPSGNRYEGELVNGVRQGRGVFIYANGTRCEGEFRSDVLEGAGVCSFPNGNRYQGEFRSGRQHGRGIYIFADGKQVEGNWQDGRFIAPEKK
jgi:hypothetical protein